MSRSGFSDADDDYGDHAALDQGRWMAWRNKAFNGPRGRAFLAELKDALEAMPEKRLIAEQLARDGEVCAIGAVGKARGMLMDEVDPEDYEAVAKLFNLPKTLVREVVYANDEAFYAYDYNNETPEHRWGRMHVWVTTNELKRISA